MHGIEEIKQLNRNVAKATEHGNPPESWPQPVAAEAHECPANCFPPTHEEENHDVA